MTILSKTLVLLMFNGVLFGQFLDAVLPVEFDGPGQRIRITSGYQLSGSALQIPSEIGIEGLSIRFLGDKNAKVWFQFLDLNGNWSEKKVAKIFSEPNSDRFIASVLDEEMVPIQAIRYEVESKELVEFLSAGLYDKKDRESSYVDIPRLRIKKSGVDKPTVIPRSEWGAKPPKYDYSNHPYFNKMTVHHAAGWGATSVNEGKAAVKSIQEFHQDGRGWSDIGYHFVVDMGGNIYQGRPETVLGAHVGGANTGNIGVCILGCYHPPETSILCMDEMTYATEKSLIHLYAWISDTYGVEPKVLKGHRDYFGTTSCPGDNVWPMLPQMRADISLFILYGEQPTRFSLFQNYPNPFNAATTLHYDLPEPSSVKITIFDILGRTVIQLVNQKQHFGYKKIVWNGKNSAGNLVAPGIYLYKAELGSHVEMKKMVLIK